MAGYQVGNFYVDVDNSQLLAGEAEIVLRPMAFKLLKILCARRGMSMSIEDLCEEVWGRSKPANCGHSLHVLADIIKTALSPEGDKYVQIDAKRGCRLTVMVHPIERSAPHDPGARRRELERAILTSRLPTRLLQLYYSDSDLRKQSLFRYSYVVDGTVIITNIVSSNHWLGLALPITETDHKRFPIQERPATWVPLDDLAVESLGEALNAKGVKFRNNPIYCLRSFDPGGGQWIAAFSLAQYADYKIELGRLEEETARALEHSGSSPELAFKERYSQMPIREKLLPNSSVFANYGERLCAGGTNVLFAVRKPGDDDFTFWIKRRSKTVSTAQSSFSLIPSGMHQPTTRAHAQEQTSVAATVYREIFEELFDGKEVEGDDSHLNPLWFMSKPQLAWFRDNRDKFRLEVVSFGLNLMDGTYEFGVLLVVTDEIYWKLFGDLSKTNPEFDDSETAPVQTNDRARLAAIMTDSRCAATSLIALVEGLRRLHQLEPTKVTLPDIHLIS